MIWLIDKGYVNPNVQTSYPKINGLINVGSKTINVTYNLPVVPSNNNNITICQTNKEKINLKYNSSIVVPNNIAICNNGQDILRQTFPADSSHCELSKDQKILSIQLITSTFNLPNTNYYAIVGDGALKQLSNGQPLIGIRENIWSFTTGKYISIY